MASRPAGPVSTTPMPGGDLGVRTRRQGTTARGGGEFGCVGASSVCSPRQSAHAPGEDDRGFGGRSTRPRALEPAASPGLSKPICRLEKEVGGS